MKSSEDSERFRKARMQSDLKLARVLSDAQGLVSAVKGTDQTSYVREQAKRLERALVSYREALDTERQEQRRYHRRIEEIKNGVRE